jgi:hypothetical protein
MTKQEFVVSKFKESYPGFSWDYDKIMAVVSKSNKLSLWYDGVKKDWDLFNITPKFFMEVLDYPEFQKYKDKVVQLRQLRSKLGEEILKQSKEQTNARNKLIDDYNEKFSPILKDDVVFILSMNSQFLTFELIEEIIDYRPSSTDKDERKIEISTFESKTLDTFKLRRLEEWKEGKFDRSKWEIK